MSTDGRPTLQGQRILVVEDEYLTAATVVDMLEEAGARILGPFGWLDEALQFVRSNHSSIVLAVLDVNLHGVKSYPLADLLTAHTIRFLFATGYGGSGLEPRYRPVRRCEKPFTPAVLVDTLLQDLAE